MSISALGWVLIGLAIAATVIAVIAIVWAFRHDDTGAYRSKWEWPVALSILAIALIAAAITVAILSRNDDEPADTLCPPPPTLLTLTSDGETLDITATWSFVEGATDYTVTLSDSQDFSSSANTVSQTVKSTSAVFDAQRFNIKSTTTYYAHVTSVVDNRCHSAPSNVLSVTTNIPVNKFYIFKDDSMTSSSNGYSSSKHECNSRFITVIPRHHHKEYSDKCGKYSKSDKCSKYSKSDKCDKYDSYSDSMKIGCSSVSCDKSYSSSSSKSCGDKTDYSYHSYYSDNKCDDSEYSCDSDHKSYHARVLLASNGCPSLFSEEAGRLVTEVDGCTYYLYNKDGVLQATTDVSVLTQSNSIWSYDDSTKQWCLTRNSTVLCLTVENSSKKDDGVPIYLQMRMTGAASQRWTIQSADPSHSASYSDNQSYHSHHSYRDTSSHDTTYSSYHST